MQQKTTYLTWNSENGDIIKTCTYLASVRKYSVCRWEAGTSKIARLPSPNLFTNPSLITIPPSAVKKPTLDRVKMFPSFFFLLLLPLFFPPLLMTRSIQIGRREEGQTNGPRSKVTKKLKQKTKNLQMGALFPRSLSAPSFRVLLFIGDLEQGWL